MGGRLSEWRANRAFRDRVVSEVLEPAGAGPLGRESYQIDLIRDYVVEIGLGRRMDGSEQWIEMLWRCPRFPRVMARLQEEEPDLAEAWRGVGRALFGWCAGAARAMAADHLMIEADPGAETFYTRMGAVRCGEAPSGSIAGRVLPLLRYRL